MSSFEETDFQIQAKNWGLRADFKYKSRNPYHDRLAQFEGLVMRDTEGESFQGKWASEIFKRQAPLHVEIGSGYGHFLMAQTEAHPEINMVGLDYRFKRSFQLAKRLNQREEQNVRFLRAKGERLAFLFGEAEVDTLHYYFPDPWPKARHHKKRLFQLPFLAQAHKVLKPQGLFFVKTDHDGYAQWMDEVLRHDKQFRILYRSKDLWNQTLEHEGDPSYADELKNFETKFEKIFKSQQTPIKAWVLQAR